MSYRLVIKPLAEQDIIESYLWYNEKQPGLGEHYLKELERCFELLKMNPHQYQIRYKQIRMAKIKRFPIC